MTSEATTGRVVLDGLAFPEGPRWHEGRLWFSDMHSLMVVAVDEEGNREDIVRVENCPSGLGWLPDGRMLVVSMNDRRLLRLEKSGKLTQVADLSSLASFHCNDMVVDHEGRAYIGNFGFDLVGKATPVPANLIMVSPKGRTQIAAKEMMFSNGTVITPDGKTMIIAETFAARISAFDIAEDGTLSNRRVWAAMEGAVPDGICLDAEGAIWVASPVSAEVLRIVEGGKVTDRISVSTQAYACMLGGADGKTLFVCTASSSNPSECTENRDGRIEAFPVKIGHAGRP
ncbi:MAG: sugar lactone lactonase YvrE [Myxococcota bacterium]|jgi:sugar lactone lactonase YvrE